MKNLDPRDLLYQTQRPRPDDFSVVDFPRIEKVTKVLRKEPPGKLLDIGYLTGSFADYLVKEGWECIGLDLNPHENSPIPIINCDLNARLPVPSESFDVVTAGEIIEHVFYEGAFLDECRRVLKKSGRLVITTPNISYSLNRVLVFLGKLPRFVHEPYHYHFHTKMTITRLVEEHGFSIEKVVSSHVLYSRRKHVSGRIFEWLGDLFPTFGAHLIVFARKK